MELDGKRLVLVGGAGLIGSHTVDRLLQTNVGEILVYTRPGARRANLKAALKDSRVRLVEGGEDPLAAAPLEAAFEGADGVFHMAAMWLLDCREHPSEAFEVNVRGTFNVIRACLAQKVKRLIFSSSAAAYAETGSPLLTEDAPLDPTSFYGASKVSAEAMLKAFHHEHGLDYLTLRYMNVYGPRQDYSGAYISVIMKMLDAIDRGEGPTVAGDGSDTLDFVAVEDCAEANVKAMQASTTDRAYNICTGRPTTLLKLAELLIELTGAQTRVRFTTKPNGTHSRRRIGSPDRAATELRFSATIELREGLRRLIAWRSADKASSARTASC